jgi:CRISPR/Cas system CSM-associated protein Csm3 (group 7 of RAMP superfamily)
MTMTSTARPQADPGQQAHLRSVAFIVFTLRFTESGGVTVPGRADHGVDRRIGGSAETGPGLAHAALDTGPDGRTQIPGTSLAGALRDMIRHHRGADVADQLFGRLLAPGGSGEDADAQASRLWVLGSRRLDDGSAIRSSTKISRHRAAAEANTLRTEEVLPVGSTFEVFLRWDNPELGEIEKFAGLLAAWRPFLGRGVSRGRGACAIDAVRHGTLRLDNPGGLLRWLTISGPDLARAVAGTEVHAADQAPLEPLLRAEISIDGPWRTGSGEEPEGRPIPLFRVSGVPTVPGSGLKGLLRSRAEYILRSVGVTPPPCAHQQCGMCWPCQVFGHGGGQDQDAETVGARAAIRIPDAGIREPVGTTRTHVAIDRFTGGALPGALYTMEVLEAGVFTLQVDPLGEVPPGLVPQIRAVLRLVLEDLNDGIIGMGGGVARGYGTVRVDLTGTEAATSLPSLAEARRELREMTRGG